MKLEIFVLLGRRVKILDNEQQLAGIYQVSFDGRSLASSMYDFLVQADFTQIQKMTLIKL